MEEISINIESGSMIQNEIAHSKEGNKDVSCSISIEDEGPPGGRQRLCRGTEVMKRGILFEAAAPGGGGDGGGCHKLWESGGSGGVGDTSNSQMAEWHNNSGMAE